MVTQVVYQQFFHQMIHSIRQFSQLECLEDGDCVYLVKNRNNFKPSYLLNISTKNHFTTYVSHFFKKSDLRGFTHPFDRYPWRIIKKITYLATDYQQHKQKHCYPAHNNINSNQKDKRT